MKPKFRRFMFLTTLVALILTPAAAHGAAANIGSSPTPTPLSSVSGDLSPSDHYQSRTWRITMPPALCDAVYQANPQLLHGQPRGSASCAATETMGLGPSQRVVTPDGGSYYVENVSMELCSADNGGCLNWKNDVQGQAQYNGSYVYQYGTPSCTPTNYWPYSQSITWCGTANNGGQGSGYISMGDNFTVYPAAGSCSAYQRVDVALNGHESAGGSSTGGC